MAQATLTINASRLWWSSPMIVCANRNHVHNEYGWNYDDGSINGKAGLRPRFVTELAKFRPAWGSSLYGRNTWGYRHGHEPTDGTNRLGDRGWNGFFFDDPGMMTREGPYPYDAMKYICQEMVDFQATATWVVNFGSAWLRHGTNGFSAPQHAANLVKWLNDADSAQRSANWRAAPLNVKWFEMGNEMSMKTQFGHGSYLTNGTTLDTTKPHFASSPIEYATNAAQLAFKMHEADAARVGGPLGIKCMFTTGTGIHFDGNGGWGGYGTNSYNVVRDILLNSWVNAAGQKVAAGTAGATLQCDGFIVHAYPSWPVGGDSKSMTLKQKMAMATWAEPKLASARQAAIDYGDGRSEGFYWANTEHFTKWYAEKDQRYAGAMYGIDMLMLALRNGFVFNNAFCLYHGRNNDDEVLFYNGDPLTPTAWGTFLRDAFVKYWGDETVTATWAAGTCPTWQHMYPEASGTTSNFAVPHLAVAASKSGNAQKLYVMILNRTQDTDHTVLLRQANIAGFTFNEAAAVRMAKLTFTGANGPEVDVWNAFKLEDRVLLPANGAYHVLTAERMSAAIYELTTTDGGGSAPPPPTPPAAPTITTVSPTLGPVGTLVEITGTGFSAVKAENEVRFGGATGTLVPEADKVSASATKLVVRVPTGAITGGTYVKVGGQAVTGPTFTVKESEPRLDRVEPMAGYVGDTVIIYGQNFNPASLTVLLGLLPATVTGATSTQITCTVPEGAVDYQVIVMTNGYTAETAGAFDVLEQVRPDAPPESQAITGGIAFGRVFVDTVPLDGESPWVLDHTATDWGDVEHPEPSVIPTTGGSFTVYPMDTVMKPRRGRVVVYAEADDELHKAKLESELKGLLAGRRTLSNGSRHLEVQFLSAREVQNDSRRAATIVGVEAAFVAPDPRWKLNQPIKGVFKATRLGPQFGIFDDQMVPMVVPEYEFAGPSFTIQNWGTAWTYGAGFIQNGPRDSLLYLHGPGEVRARVVIDGAGNGRFDEGHEFFLKAGRNAVRVEKLNGLLIDPPAGFTISFIDTTPRFL